jgi:hypothetical protein
MAQPEPTPIELPHPELSSERAAAHWRVRILFLALSVQLLLGVFLSATFLRLELGVGAFVVFALNVAPSAGALWGLVGRREPALSLCLLSGVLFYTLRVGPTVAGNFFVQHVATLILLITASLMWSHGAFKRPPAL